MVEEARERPLTTLAPVVVLVLAGATGVALFALRNTPLDWLPLVLITLLGLLVAAGLWMLLDAADRWLGSHERTGRMRRRQARLP